MQGTAQHGNGRSKLAKMIERMTCLGLVKKKKTYAPEEKAPVFIRVKIWAVNVKAIQRKLQLVGWSVDQPYILYGRNEANICLRKNIKWRVKDSNCNHKLL